MAIEFISDKELPEGAPPKAPFIPVRWFTEEFKAALVENPNQWGLMNEGKEADRSYFEGKLKAQAKEVADELGGSVELHFERVEKEPKEVVIKSGPNEGKKSKVYFYQGKVRAKFVPAE